MTLKRKAREIWAAAKWGAGLAVVSGFLVLILRTPLERWSYDLPHIVRPPVEITNVAIVYMDDLTHTVRGQRYDAGWDRSLQAQLVEALTKFGAKAIAFDVLFTDPGPDAAASLALAKAIRSHGQVVLGADVGSGDYYALAIELKVILAERRSSG